MAAGRRHWPSPQLAPHSFLWAPRRPHAEGARVQLPAARPSGQKVTASPLGSQGPGAPARLSHQQGSHDPCGAGPAPRSHAPLPPLPQRTGSQLTRSRLTLPALTHPSPRSPTNWSPLTRSGLSGSRSPLTRTPLPAPQRPGSPLTRRPHPSAPGGAPALTTPDAGPRSPAARPRRRRPPGSRIT